MNDKGFYSNNLDIRWALHGDPDEASDRSLLLSLQSVDLATIPGLEICDNDRLTISSSGLFRYSYCGKDSLRQAPNLFFSSDDQPLEVSFKSDDRHQGRGMEAEILVVTTFVGSLTRSTPVNSSGYLLSPFYPTLLLRSTLASSEMVWEIRSHNCSSVQLQLKTAVDGESCKALSFAAGGRVTWLCGNETAPLELDCGSIVRWVNPDGERLAASLESEFSNVFIL